jgi:hypothetical protein
LQKISRIHETSLPLRISYHPGTNRYTTIPNHPGGMPVGTLRAILKQAGIKPEVFLQKSDL